MRLYLSSYKLGAEPNVLRNLVRGGKSIGVIRNALDFSLDQRRLHEGRIREFEALMRIGLIPEEIDLREFFGNTAGLEKFVSELDALWVIGGNAFLLNYAVQQSGLSKILLSRMDDDDFVYAGYSAGVCILSPTLEGMHRVDDPRIAAEGYPERLPWNGLGMVPFNIVPHWRSDHPESPRMDDVVEYFMVHKMPFIALRDGEVYVTTVRELYDRSSRRLPAGDVGERQD